MRWLNGLLVMAVLACSGTLWAAGGVLPGGGTEGDPYLIEDLADFDAFADSVNAPVYWASGVYTRLACDPNLAGRTYTTAVIAPDTSTSGNFQGTPFEGIFDGDGYVISNLTIDTAGAGNDYLGLFGSIEGSSAEVKDLGQVLPAQHPHPPLRAGLPRRRPPPPWPALLIGSDSVGRAE